MRPSNHSDYSDQDINALVEQLASSLRANDEVVSCAESCTGGWLAKCLTDRPGSSQWFGSGFVTYSNTAKTAMLNVPPPLLERCGAVSAEVVEAMADGALNAAAADFAVSISGIAGPGGGSAEKPVGLVWIGTATPSGRTSVKHQFDGSRDDIRRQAVVAALLGLIERISEPSNSS